MWTRVLRRGRTEVLKAADEGRAMVKVRSLQRDIDALKLRLGKTAYLLYEEGELEHPSFAKAVRHIRALEEEIAELRITSTEQEG